MSEPTTSNTKLPWLIVGGVVVLIALTMFFQRSRGEDPALSARAPAEQVNSAEDLPDAGPRIKGRAAPATRQSTRQIMQERRRAMAEKRQQVQDNVDRTQAAFASRYSSEKVDAAWAGGKEAALAKLSTSSQIDEMGVQPKNLLVDCKTSVCRVTADFPNMSMGDDWITLYMNNAAAEVPVASYKYIQNPDGTVTINAYAIGRR